MLRLWRRLWSVIRPTKWGEPKISQPPEEGNTEEEIFAFATEGMERSLRATEAGILPPRILAARSTKHIEVEIEGDD